MKIIFQIVVNITIILNILGLLAYLLLYTKENSSNSTYQMVINKKIESRLLYNTDIMSE